MEQLRQYAREYQIDINDAMLEKFMVYREVLLDWNQRMNLTAITEPGEIAIKHFLDSLLLLATVEVPPGCRLIDVGTGAGFPGIPIKIVRPDIQLTLLDSLQKRIGFLQEVSKRLGQDNRCLHGRAEDFGRKKDLREHFDLVTARAVAAMPVLSEYCLPFAGVQRYFVAMKGPQGELEGRQAREALHQLGGQLQSMKRYTLPDGSERMMLVVKKVSQMSAKYPRTSSKIAKSPL